LVEIMTAMRAKAKAIGPAKGLHGLGRQPVLAHRLCQVENLVPIDEEGIGVGGWGQQLAGGGVHRREILLLKGEGKGIGYVSQTAAAPGGDGAVEGGRDQYPLVRPHEVDAARQLAQAVIPLG
jgi:hypothetical protein